MAKLWQGRSDGNIDAAAEELNRSITFDSRMYKEDITGSIAHTEMLANQSIITRDDADTIVSGLSDILSEIENGKLDIDLTTEDIHTFVETELTKRYPDAGKRLHTARSRNDQVALDLRLYLRSECGKVTELLRDLIITLCGKAREHTKTVMPGYTHLQRAQPVTFGHHLMAYTMMFLRDLDRIDDALKRVNISPIGCCALAGTTYDTDRKAEAERLGFSDIARNSLDGVSDRDFCVELCADLSLIMAHISRFSEEIVLWSSWEFKFISLSDAYSTGSSIMPQKKNPDMAELCRGKTGRVYGDLITLLTMLKGLPLAYNKDMQEDKEAIFDAFDTVILALTVFAPMIETMTVNSDRMRAAASEGFINATDLADYLVGRGMAFREAYKIVGGIVAKCVENGKTLETMTLDEYKQYSELFDDTLYAAIDIDECVKRRISEGGPTERSVLEQIEYVMGRLK